MDTTTSDFLLALADTPLADGGIGPYAFAFGQGLLVDLTPCVFPLIPITVAVFGAKGVSRPRALLLATSYVLGMASLYTALAVVVALTGAAFGAWLANPWVVIPIVGLLLALAASMFGAFDLQLPSALQGRLNTIGGAGPAGAFLMGLVAAFLVAPCTGPVLLGLLALVAKNAAAGGSIAYGASLLFVFALGQGTLFFAVALGASLFRPGPWMDYVKSFFGIMLVVMALWFLRPIAPALGDIIVHPQWGYVLGAGLIGVGVVLGAIHLSFYGPASERVRKGVGIAIAVVGAQIGLNNLLYVPPADWHEAETLEQLQAALTEGEASGKPMLVDFAANWCLPCKEMEIGTFHDARVEPVLSERFFLIKVDVSEGSDEQVAIQAAFASGSLPSVLVYPSDQRLTPYVEAMRKGELVPEPAVQFRTLVGPDEFLTAITPIE